MCVGQVDFLTNETDARFFSTESGENMRRPKKRGREVKEEKHNRGAGRYLRVDADL